MAADPQLVEAGSKAAGIIGIEFLKVMAIVVPIVFIALFIRRSAGESLNRFLWRRSKTEKKCPVDGGTLMKRRGKYGPFLGCSNYPQCKYTEGGKRE